MARPLNQNRPNPLQQRPKSLPQARVNAPAPQKKEQDAKIKLPIPAEDVIYTNKKPI
jgi:hypothetical protein